MVNVLTSTTHQGAYRNLLQVVLEGERIDVRGRPTREILNNVLEITNPINRCILVPGRRWNPWLALSEGLWLLAGREDIAALRPYNSRISEFSDNGETTYGAYGKRIFDNGLHRVADLLYSDPDTRRAVIPIYEGRDAGASSKDIPCNTSVMFKLRDNKLHMVVTNRSNDIHWGLFAVNLCQFSMLQETMAYVLSPDIELGTQVHFSQSLHVYTDEYGQKITDAMLANWGQNVPYRFSEGMYGPGTPKIGRIDLVRALANAALDHNDDISDFPFFSFAKEFLWLYKNNLLKKAKERELGMLKQRMDGRFDDWITAGELFLAGY